MLKAKIPFSPPLRNGKTEESRYTGIITNEESADG